MNPALIAAVVILSVELIIIIVVLVFLFTGRCPPKFCHKDPSPETCQYTKTEDIDEEKAPEEAQKEEQDDSPVENQKPATEVINENENSCDNQSISDSDSNDEGDDTEVNEAEPEINLDDVAEEPLEDKVESSSSSDEGVGDVEKAPSNETTSSKSSDSMKDEPHLRSTNSVSSHDTKSVVSVNIEEVAEDKVSVGLVEEDKSSSAPVSLENGVVLSLCLDDPDPVSHHNSSSSSSSATSSDEDEQEIKVVRTFNEIPPVQDQGISLIYDPRNMTDVTIDRNLTSESEGENEHRGEIVAGIINVTSGEKLTISQAILKGLIPEKTGMLLLEAQAATGSIVNPRNGVKLSVDEAVRQGVVDQQYKNNLRAAEGGYYGFLDPRSNESVPLFEAMKRDIFSNSQGMRLLEAQLASGGIVDPWTGKRYTLSRAVKKGLIDKRTSNILTNPEDYADFFDPNTKQRFTYGNLLSKCVKDLNTGLKFLHLEEKLVVDSSNQQSDLITFRTAFKKTVALKDLVKAGIIKRRVIEQYSQGRMTKGELYDTVKPYLVGEAPIAGIYNRTNREVLTICDAVHRGLLRRGTALELLEAQAATGFIIDPRTGKQMSVNRAVSAGIVDNRFTTSLRKAEFALLGYHGDRQDNVSLFEAINRGLVIDVRGIRLLDAQIATGGIIDPVCGYRIPLSVAVKKGMVDQQLARKLTNPTADQKGYYDPNTDENVTYRELMKRTVVDKKRHVGMRLLPLTEKTPNVRVVSKAPTKARRS